MIVNPLTWLERVWPTRHRRAAVIRDYIDVGANPAFLADLALRGGVWSPLQAETPERTAYNIGRRDLALEVIKLAGTDPAMLFREIEKLSKEV
jgi:hypothetical protein